MSDLIRRSDVIKTIDDNVNGSDNRLYLKDLVNAIPSADRPQGEVDAIDRDALIDYCLKLIDVERKQGSDVMNYGQERVNQTEAIIDYIEYMPHVNADRPRGEWIETPNHTIRCSVCGAEFMDDIMDACLTSRLKHPRACSVCTASMKGVDDEAD